MSKLSKDQQDEFARCAVDFPYFCEQYVKVFNPKGNQHGEIVPFKLHPYQLRLYEHLEDNRLTIFSKFRQGGFTTELAAYVLWKCLFRLDQRILWLSKTDREAVDVCERCVKRMIEYLPEWMKGNILKMVNSHQKTFPETDSSMFFGTPEAACGKAVSFLVVDEASFIKDMDKHWKALWPVLSTGGSCCIMSTTNTDEDWFWATLEDATLKLNNFSVYRCNYKEKPEFCDPQWEAEMKNQMGQRGWECEMEQKPLEVESTRIRTSLPKSPKKLWRSIYDEWEGSGGIAPESLGDE